MRILTTTVVLENGKDPLLPVRTSTPIPLVKQQEAMKAIRKLKVSGPVCAGTIICSNIAGTGADLIASCDD